MSARAPLGAILLACVGLSASCGDVEGSRPDAAASVGGDPVASRCPEVAGTWPMVAVPRSDGAVFCIDSREVTNEQYAAFLASGATPDLHPACEGTTDFTPKADWPASAERARHPVGAVTWCDAQAFCHSNDKRLCGGPNGEIQTLDEGFGADEDTTPTEMRLACTRGGTQAFPYGAEGDASRCPYLPEADIVAADSETVCEGGYAGIFFLEGNVLEWEGRCKFEGSSEGLSGPYCMAPGQWGCAMMAVASSQNGVGVTEWYPWLGFRCCADTIAN